MAVKLKLRSYASAVVLNLGSIEPQGFGESISGVQGFGGLLGIWKRKKNYFSDYEGLDECIYGTRGIQCPQQG